MFLSALCFSVHNSEEDWGEVVRARVRAGDWVMFISSFVVAIPVKSRYLIVLERCNDCETQMREMI